MRINNFTELSNFLKSNNLSSFGKSLISCTDQYAVMCSCRPQEKANKLSECTNYYIQTITSLNGYKPQIFSIISDSSIEFYNNGQLLGVMAR
jgi:HD-GYP domain-containing protein (c-di-GMP phosphodiesterase class II)